MSNAALLRRSPHNRSRRGPAALDMRHTKRSTREFLSMRGASQARTLEDYVLLTHAAIEGGHPAPCPVCPADGSGMPPGASGGRCAGLCPPYEPPGSSWPCAGP